jgi:hypothetical protein
MRSSPCPRCFGRSAGKSSRCDEEFDRPDHKPSEVFDCTVERIITYELMAGKQHQLQGERGKRVLPVIRQILNGDGGATAIWSFTLKCASAPRQRW